MRILFYYGECTIDPEDTGYIKKIPHRKVIEHVGGKENFKKMVLETISEYLDKEHKNGYYSEEFIHELPTGDYIVIKVNPKLSEIKDIIFY